MDKQLLSIYQDFDLEELEMLADNSNEIETGEDYQTSDVVDEHLKVINYLIKTNKN